MRDYARTITVDAVTTEIARALAVAPRGTAARLARMIGVTPQTVSKWASGEVAPEQFRWPEIESTLGMEPGSLMEAFRTRVVTPPGDDHGMAAVLGRLAELGAELQQLRAEVTELRSEVHARRRASDPAPPAPSPTTRSRARTP